MTESLYLRSILFRHSMCLAYGLRSLALRAFGKGESTVKTVGQNQPDVQTQCLPEVVDGSTEQRHNKESAP